MFRIKALDKQKIKNWLDDAENHQSNDAVHAFISAWIGFNYYYCTFASENYAPFNLWSNKCFNGKKGDRAQWSFLINSETFITFFNNFKENNSHSFDISIALPIKDMLDEKKEVPLNCKGSYELKDLTTQQIFEVI